MAWIRGEQRDPDKPEPGFYALKLVKKGPEVAARIFKMEALFGQYLWGAMIDGEFVGDYVEDPQLQQGVQQIWLFGRKIGLQEYEFMLARAAHAKQHEPNSPWANPRRPIDLRTIKPIGG